MAETIITDAKGRKLTTRKLNVLDQVRLLRAIGPAQASNQPYVEIVTMAASVAAIDGVPVLMPINERSIDGAIGQIGDEGFAALMVFMRREIDTVQMAAEEAALGEVKARRPFGAIRLIATNQAMQEVMLLSKNGVPRDTILEMDAIERAGMCIAVGLVEGGKFNWESVAWEKPRA